MSKKRENIGDYIAADYVSHGQYLDEQTYGKALDSLVIACVDIVPVYQAKILLGKRAWHPQADWWIFGGRIRTGEQLVEAAARLLKNEMGVTFDPARFTYLTTFAAAWSTRAHAPEDHGAHTVSITMTVKLTNEEFKEIKLNEEYSDSKLVTPAELLAVDSYHPALYQCATLLM